jgi:hypothetical protein
MLRFGLASFGVLIIYAFKITWLNLLLIILYILSSTAHNEARNLLYSSAEQIVGSCKFLVLNLQLTILLFSFSLFSSKFGLEAYLLFGLTIMLAHDVYWISAPVLVLFLLGVALVPMAIAVALAICCKQVLFR